MLTETHLGSPLRWQEPLLPIHSSYVPKSDIRTQ